MTNPQHFTSTPYTAAQWERVCAIDSFARHYAECFTAAENEGTFREPEVVDERALALAQAIDTHCPQSADAAAANRCLRLSRMLLNKGVARFKAEHVEDPREAPSFTTTSLLRDARRQFELAIWTANEAIRCEGK